MLAVLERHLRSRNPLGEALRVLIHYASRSRLPVRDEDTAILLAISTAWNRARKPEKP